MHEFLIVSLVSISDIVNSVARLATCMDIQSNNTLLLKSYYNTTPSCLDLFDNKSWLGPVAYLPMANSSMIITYSCKK